VFIYLIGLRWDRNLSEYAQQWQSK
jgi:hypothetical protein